MGFHPNSSCGGLLFYPVHLVNPVCCCFRRGAIPATGPPPTTVRPGHRTRSRFHRPNHAAKLAAILIYPAERTVIHRPACRMQLGQDQRPAGVSLSRHFPWVPLTGECASRRWRGQVALPGAMGDIPRLRCGSSSMRRPRVVGRRFEGRGLTGFAGLALIQRARGSVGRMGREVTSARLRIRQKKTRRARGAPGALPISFAGQLFGTVQTAR